MRPRPASNWPGASAADAIVRFVLGPSLERVACLQCGELVAIVPLPTGARLAVTDATGVVHDFTCGKESGT